MTLSPLERTIALAAVALVATVAVLALTGGAREEGDEIGPRQVPVAGGGWYTALAGSRGAAGDAERTTCALILTGRSLGVSHPVLPCGAKIFISYSGSEVLTEVIDTKLKRPGRQFELTEALAQRLGVEGTQQISWRFAVRN
ncbi:MAG: hypothetical protein H0T10_05750 [Actinobacteria bacterium]|nr:hypothetical protein [Actinomycetota bacterium]